MDGTVISARHSAAFRRGWIIYWCVGIAAGLAVALLGLPLLGWIMVAVFAGMLVLTLRRFAIPAPVITIGPEGYHDRRLGTVIPWTAVRQIRRQVSGNRIFLQIAVDEPEKYLGNAGILKGPMLRINPALGFAAIGSAISNLDVPQEQLAEAAEGYLAAER
jgi:hypothetical protein